jgi:hypothetical protein
MRHDMYDIQQWVGKDVWVKVRNNRGAGFFRWYDEWFIKILDSTVKGRIAVNAVPSDFVQSDTALEGEFINFYYETRWYDDETIPEAIDDFFTDSYEIFINDFEILRPIECLSTDEIRQYLNRYRDIEIDYDDDVDWEDDEDI